MGFNPFRSHERNTADIMMVIVAILVTSGVVLWAIWG